MISFKCGIFKCQTQKKRVEWRLSGARGWGKWEDGVQRVQTPSYKIDKFWGSNIEHDDCSQQYNIIYLRVAQKADLKSSHCDHNKNKWQFCEMKNVLTSPTVEIYLQYTHVLSYHILHLTLIHYYVSYISIQLEKKKKWSRSDLKKKKAREVLSSLFYGNLCNPG